MNLLPGLLGGFLVGAAWKAGQYHLLFGFCVYLLLSSIAKYEAIHTALGRVEEKLKRGELVIVDVKELKKYGLRAVDGGVEKEVSDV